MCQHLLHLFDSRTELMNRLIFLVKPFQSITECGLILGQCRSRFLPFFGGSDSGVEITNSSFAASSQARLFSFGRPPILGGQPLVEGQLGYESALHQRLVGG